MISFVLIGKFVSQSGSNFSYPKLDASKLAHADFFTSDSSNFLIKVASVLIFIVTLSAGFLGPKIATTNFATLFVWIIFWLGLTYFIALFGNIWSVANPWKIVVKLLETIKGREFIGLIKYPRKLGYLPALILYYGFIWLELLSNGWGAKPAYLAIIILAYSLLNFAGAILFGKKIWFKYCEFFSVYFKLIGKLSPINIIGKRIFLRPPFVGLLDKETGRFSLLLFIIFMLSSTAFDGFRSTITWRKVDSVVSQLAVGADSYQIIESALLALSPVFFLVLYLYAIVFIKTIVKTNYSFWELSTKFTYSLIPIALAYNIAHYYTLLLIQGQSVITAVSDPFENSWNLFNTASYKINVGVVSAGFVWHSQIAVIIIGHIAAVYIAHVIALRVFPSHKAAIISQIPMLILMIVYTMTGLWILSQPLTLGG